MIWGGNDGTRGATIGRGEIGIGGGAATMGGAATIGI
jgi:hypothetical protein